MRLSTMRRVSELTVEQIEGCYNDPEIVKMRQTMLSKWVSRERFVKLIDKSGNGYVDYDEFYDLTSQFGLRNAVDADAVFATMDIENTGLLPVHDLLDCLTPTDSDWEDCGSCPMKKEDPYPTDLLVGLVAHNNMKPSMMKFVKENVEFFSKVKLVTTGSTGRALASLGLEVEHLVSSGPLGGDQEIGALISQGKVAAVFFFTDPLSAHPHQADIEALNRICCVHDCMFANNPSTAASLVYSLQFSPCGLSRLLGVNPEMSMDTSVVEAYKNNQQKVINAVAEQKRKSSVMPAGEGGEPSRSTLLSRSRSSTLFAPKRGSSSTTPGKTTGAEKLGDKMKIERGFTKAQTLPVTNDLFEIS